MTERDVVVPELDSTGRLTHQPVLDQIAEIAEEKASAASGGIQGVHAGAGRPDIPETLDGPIPEGARMFVSTDAFEGVPTWTRIGTGAGWRPVNGSTNAFLSRSVVSVVTLAIEVTGEAIMVTDVNPRGSGYYGSVEFNISAHGRERSSAQINGPSSGIVAPEGRLLALSAPIGAGLAPLGAGIAQSITVGGNKLMGRPVGGGFSERVDLGLATALPLRGAETEYLVFSSPALEPIGGDKSCTMIEFSYRGRFEDASARPWPSLTDAPGIQPAVD